MRRTKRITATFIVILMTLSFMLPQMPLEVYAAEENPYGGQDYYLDYSGGNDSNDGMTPEKAWKNLVKANETTFKPGDRILLKCGETWENQQLWPKGSGEEGKPITIDRYGDPDLGNPYIATNGNVEYPITNGTRDKNKVGLTGAIVLRNQQYWEIHHMELSNDDDFETDITTSNIVRDGISITINADLLEDGEDNIMNYFRITDNYIHDIDGKSTWQQIHYGGICFQVFGENGYDTYGTGGYYFQDVVIENNSFYKTELHAIQFAFNWFYDRSSQYGEYDDAGKYHEGWEQLWVRTRDLYSRDIYIGHNYCENIGQGAIQLANTKNMVVEYNEINGFLKRYNQVSCGLYLWAGADSVMQYNEVYDGPYDEYDGTPFDMEYTNFDVTYQYNYSHDNKAGWMSYMGNSSNSIARYNLSVNDNGVIVKNMLSTNYAPSYFVNNVFIYDAAQMDYFHDEVFKDTVYFYNNIFYNYSETTTTPWYRRSNALANAVFSNNVYFEASGTSNEKQPEDKYGISEDPQFVSDPLDYPTGLGVDNIVQAAQNYKLKDTSPLIDAGHYSVASGTEDFFETHLYYGDEIDIGLYEAKIGEKVVNPVEKEFEDKEPERINLALNKPITANYTHPTTSQDVKVGNLVDGNTATRWACCDPDDMTDGWPIIITIDLEDKVAFNEIYLDEYEDSGTKLRIQSFELQRWDEENQEWATFITVAEGMGHDLTLDDFGTITSSKLRLLITGQKATEYWTPSMTEIQVYYNEDENVDPPVDKTMLKQTIDYAESIITSGEYEEDAAMEAYKALLEEAKEAYEDPNITDTEITVIIEALAEGEAALNPVVKFDTTNLALEITRSETTLSDIEKGLYLEVGQTNFKQALETAKNVLDNPLSQDEINQAAYNLRQARLSLCLIPSKDALAALLAQAEQIDESLYTSVSVTVLRNAVAFAAEIYDNAQSDAEQVKEAENVLSAALKQLSLISEKEPESTEDTKQTEGTKQTEDTKQTGDTKDADSSGTEKNKGASISKITTGDLKTSDGGVKTGDYIPIMLLAGLAFISGLIVICLFIKRRKTN